VPGGVFWDPDSDAAFLKTLRGGLRPDIPVRLYERHVNDPEFGREVADLFVTRGQRLVRADGYPPHQERYQWSGIDLTELLAHDGAV